MKKLALSASLIATFMLYVFYARPGTSPVYAPPSMTQSGMGGGNMMPPMGHMGTYKDGEYVGKVVDVYYGNLELKAVIHGGRLTDVIRLQEPNDRKTSIDISNSSLPVLIQEAIKAQGANVDTISGATQTSDGFVQSLGDALAKAKI